ncbi:MAG TPA: hypothetical protein EYH08_07745 [Pyrodictium sp.]|nr:hypothetical protein [Pyrodictium sp.]
MPVVYRCSNCGYILDIFVKVGQNSYGVPTPSEVAARYGGYCPMCGKPLNTKPRLHDIVIEPNGMQKLVQVLKEARNMMRIGFKSILRLLPENLREELLSATPSESLLNNTMMLSSNKQSMEVKV